MKSVLVVMGSVRKQSVNASVTDQIVERLDARGGIATTVADLGRLGMPFFDAPVPPSNDSFMIEHESVKQWQEMVTAADYVVFVMPEYNHSMTAVQKNAIDWLYSEWRNKPVGIVAYGAYAGKHALASFSAINDVVKMNITEPIVQFTLGEKIGYDGSISTPEDVQREIDQMIDALLTEE